MDKSANIRRKAIFMGSAIVALGVGAVAAHGQQVGDIFVIALENHNFTQPNPAASPQQLLNNPAAPYLNGLVNGTNSQYVSYATNYTNAGLGVHPSEPNYVWAEAGTNFNPQLTGALQGSGNVNVATNTNKGVINGTTVKNDNDSSAANGNIFTNVPHLTGQLNSVGVPWNNYQEDFQVSGTGPTHSSSGTLPGGAVNPYYGTGQYNYAEKHNPMAYFPDTQNVASPISQLATDLNNNTVGKYNWITPNQFNDMHSSLSTDFSYAGQTWTHGTDQQAVAIGDHFLSVIIPQIEASAAWQNNGAIIIWNDETENGDTTGQTSTEIVISKLAKGGAYASTVSMNHSSDIKTMEELFQTQSYIDNAIPSGETAALGGFNTVIGSNDLSDLFKAGAIPTSVPEPASFGLIAVTGLGLLARRRRRIA